MNWKRCIEMGVKSSPQFARALCASRRIPLSHAYAFARRPRVETRLHVQRDFGCLELIEHHLRLASLHAFCDDKLPRIIVDNITRVDFLGCVDLGKDLSNLALVCTKGMLEAADAVISAWTKLRQQMLPRE